MNIVWYEDEFCYYVWKPSNIPTTFGKEFSFLELLFQQEQQKYPFIQRLSSVFSREEEWGLLNRLDNATTWLLYFAKSHEIKKHYKVLQHQWKVRKYYLVEIYWDIRYWIKKYGKIIDFPIAHHKFSPERMIVIDHEIKKSKADWKLHFVQTKIVETQRNEKTGTTTLLVSIQKGIRHQIRCHFSAIGYPIVWDEYYGKKKDPMKWNLQLFSIGLEVSS